MRALILAAGRGTRISRYLSGHPKCTVDIGNGESLIEYTIDLLHAKKISQIGMVLGYGQEIIRDMLKDCNVSFYYNPFFDVTNSIASAWFARDFIRFDDDLIIMNGDVYIDETLLENILNEEKSPVMFADESRTVTADYKFYYKDHILIKYGKELEGDDITGEYIGLGKFSKEFLPDFITKMNQMINSQKHGVWWENILYEMTGTRPVYVEDVKGCFWAEVDYIEDYERILVHRGYSRLMEKLLR